MLRGGSSGDQHECCVLGTSDVSVICMHDTSVTYGGDVSCCASIFHGKWVGSANNKSEHKTATCLLASDIPWMAECM